MRRVIAACFISSACPVLAEDFLLSQPVDCTLGQDCYIQQYMDRDPGPEQSDYRCNGLSYDGHKGTDFALPTRAAMAEGVNVLAAAGGTVRGVRDGMPDSGWGPETKDSITGRECGNGIVLLHRNGWETQYCHMKQGSVTVRRGQVVQTGAVLGQIGMSGRSEFPHLHISVRKNGTPVDPFDPDGTVDCAAPGDSSLWSDPPDYLPGGLIDIGVTDAMPAYDAIKAGTAAQDMLHPDAPALIVYGFAFGLRAGDVIRLSISGPDGEIVAQDTKLKRDHAQAFRAVGKQRRIGRRWAVGVYEGVAELLRGGEAISRRKVALEITQPG